MEKTTNKITTYVSAFGLAAGLSVLGLHAGQAKADGAVASVASASAARAADGLSQGQIAVLKTENLYRFQQRPFVRVPEGVALRVRAPEGMTAADLHNKLNDCSKATDRGSPLCVEGASLKVARAGGTYVVSITSDSRSTALEIQRRAAAHK